MPAASSCPITLPTDTPPLELDEVLTATPGLLDMLRRVPDPRARRGVRHDFFAVLALSIMAVLTGARGYAAIWRWSAQALPETLQALDCHRAAIASESTFRRILQALDPDELMLLIATWLAGHLDRLQSLQQRQRQRSPAAAELAASTQGELLTACVIAIDGKTVRGSRDGYQPGTHLLAALHTDTATVLGQQTVNAKTNEITHLPTLLALLDERCLLPAGAVITADALHTQRDTAQAITGLGLDYALTWGYLPRAGESATSPNFTTTSPRCLGRRSPPRIRSSTAATAASRNAIPASPKSPPASAASWTSPALEPPCASSAADADCTRNPSTTASRSST